MMVLDGFKINDSQICDAIILTTSLLSLRCKTLILDGTYRKLMTIEEAFVELENYVDASDPDLDLVSTCHFQQFTTCLRKFMYSP